MSLTSSTNATSAWTNSAADFVKFGKDWQTWQANPASFATVVNDVLSLGVDLKSALALWAGQSSPPAALASLLLGANAFTASFQKVTDEYNSGGINNVKLSDLFDTISGAANFAVGASALVSAGVIVGASGVALTVPVGLVATVTAVGASANAISAILTLDKQSDLTIGQAGNVLSTIIGSNGSIFNDSKGGSAVVYTSGLPSGYQTATQLYSGQSGTGTLISTTITTTSGWSQVQQFANLPSGASTIYTNYSGINGQGSVTWQLQNNSNGTSVVTYYQGLPTGISSELIQYSGASGTGSVTQATLNLTGGGSQIQQFANLSSGVSEMITNYSGANGTGNVTSKIQDNSNGTSVVTSYLGLPSGIASVVQQYSGTNGSGTLNQTILNTISGWSQVQQFTNLPSGVTVIDTNYSGLNGTGAVTWVLQNFSNGTSTVTSWQNLPTGTSSVLQYFSGTNQTGTVTKTILNMTNGASQVQQTTGLPSGVTAIYTNYSGSNGTGSIVSLIQDNSDGTSAITSYQNLPSGVSSEILKYSGKDGSGTLTQATLNTPTGWSQLQQFLASGTTSKVTNYAGANATGAITWMMSNNANNTSTATWSSGLPTGYGSITETFSGQNGSGNIVSETRQSQTGSDTINFNYNNSGMEQFYTDSSYSSSGALTGTTTYTSGGTTNSCSYSPWSLYISYGDVNCGGNSEYGFAGTTQIVGGQLNQNVGFIANYDLSIGDNADAAIAKQALQNLRTTAISGSYAEVYDGAKWNSSTPVTWSLASLASGLANAPFSSYISSSYTTIIQNAFKAWNLATGLTFQQVSDATSTDIRIGFGIFNTSSSGIVGLTNTQGSNGQLNANTIIRLEDVSQDALVTGSDGATQTYSGTQATFYQTLLHEIGHALGLGSNADPNSIMNYQLNGSNRTLDANDVYAATTIYKGASAAVSANLNQLVQSIGALAPAGSIMTSPSGTAANSAVQNYLLAATH